VAHGFQTLSDTAEVAYQMTEFYTPGAEQGILWCDSAIAITWPIPDPIVSARDQSHPTWVHLFGEHYDPNV
jgi:dTDP-4-dehydrorhamnose 3,5-epimerase